MSPAEVLEFWFGPPGSPPLASSTKWYTKDAAFDAEVRARFGETHALAAAGKLDEWKETPRGRLALVIVLDQFSRNMYRGDARAFACDDRARDLALEALSTGEDRQLEPIERTFLYMPLMHAEDSDLQRKCIAAFAVLADKAPPDLQKYVANGLDYAKQHAEIIERFGRFPHRNEILGRDSTSEEVAFLKQPGSSF
ncbi:MAG: DUF924 domain-containing protein [Labilithrix sp.]|nr:DUF924 domain-containing protein [Labilithrix sp.]MCW5815968.1 DUF924 domain-containing protein [Labilithrix sp.]